MSRRKQLNPRHLESEQVLATSLLPNDDAMDSQSEEEGGGDEHVCGRCRAEFVELADFLGHKKKCTRKRIVVIVSDEFGQDGATSDQEDLNSFSTSSYYRDLEYNGDMANQKRNEDLENNNSVNYEKEMADGKADDDGDTLTDKEMMAKAGLNISGYNHVPSFPLSLALSDSNVSLEVLHNTKVAVAQFPLSTLANANGLPPQDLVVLQSTLYTLQQQQLLQLQLIQQLQHQLESQKPGSSGTNNNNNNNSANNSANCNSHHSTAAAASNLGANGSNSALNLVSTSATTSTSTTASASSMATSSIELNQPNSLELLQRSAQQVLNNASQGLLANGLDFSKGKTSSSNGSYDSKSATSRNEEPFFKHRCRFCGKVFGSDSALQIHIRSHTGERPFKCNVCGNRFSTRGNLKVHFQRHKVKYPHIKMNPNPVPEHLDRFHPPLMPHEAPQYRSNGPPERSSYPGLSSSPLPPQLSRQSPILGPLDLGHKPPSIAPTLLPTLPNESNLVPLRRDSESPASVSKAMTPSEDSRENSMERSLSPAMSMKSEERAKSASPTNIDESSKDSMTLDKRDGGMSPLDLPKISAASSPSTPSRHHHHHHHHHHHPHHPHHHSHHHSHHSHSHSHIPITSFSSLIPMTSTPTTFSNSHSLSTLTAASALHMSTLPLTEPALDPAVYTPLLPKPGSNDNSWESLIEITKTSETSKLQQLVDNIEHKLSDPNQCVICHRVLSCKSALQMHYRTHTGERPFKCKICGRAFTTKGNLKTHMGVHRAKPPMRVLHQCPVCHKKFTNALVLQQHIRMHTGEPTELSPEQIQAAEIKDYPPTLHPALPHLMHSPTSVGNSTQISLMPSAMMKPNPLPPSLMSPGPHASDMRTSESESVIKSSSSLSEGEKSSDGESVVCKPNSEGLHGLPASAIVPTFSTSLAALENHVKAINTIVPSHLSNYGNLMNLSDNLHHHDDSSSMSMNEDSAQNGDKSPDIHRSSVHSQRDESPMDERSTPSLKVESPSPGVTASTVSHTVSAAHSPASVISVATSESFMAGALDLTPKTSVITSVCSDSMSIPNSFPGLPLAPHLLTPNSRLSNTTCNICFKTFACNSALEIHYRSHTKERPFKCNACDRAFSTKGNMKQHMLTHKIRDLPPQLFDSSQSNPSNAPRQQQQQQHQHQHQHQHQQQHHQQQHSGGESVSNSPGASPTNVPNSLEPTSLKRPHQQENNNNNSNSSNNNNNSSSNNNNNESPLPLPKRPPGLPKHLCHVCHKNFSSASALQIHMRTHTGDRPFKCTICERAFTTKGNLKVHMGTHMWNNGTSRRGRRMSIELPPIPLTAKDSEFMQRRPDLYFPFMAAPFMNGLATKVNEISVIQSAAMNNGGLTSPPMGIVPVGSGISDMSPLVKCSAPSTTPTSTPSSTPLPELDLSVKKTPIINDHHPTLPPSSSLSSSTCNKPPQHSPQQHDDQPADMSKNTSWVWKLACNLCNKVCSSPTELEHHLQAHYNMELKSDAPPRSSPHPENLAV